MGFTLIGWPDRTLDVAAALSGGNWQAGLPRANLQNALLSKIARSTNATSAYTQFVITYAAPKDVRIIALLNHNISLAGTIRVRGYSDAGLTALVYDTGTQYAWPQTFTVDDVAAYPNHWIWPLPAVNTARYWKVEIVDTANTAGYLQLGRCWLGPALEPASGVDYNDSLAYLSNDVLDRSLGGVLWGEKRTPQREGIMTFSVISPSERRAALIMQKTLGTVGELLLVRNSAAAAEDMLLDAFPCTLEQADALTYPYFNNYQMPMKVKEII